MADIDAGIQLNLYVGGLDNVPDKSKRRATGSRGARIKARRAEKQESYSANKQTISQSPARPGKRKAEVEADASTESSAKRTKPGSQVISSLFVSNPDIPLVKSEPIESIKEKVFSTKSFGDIPLHPYMISNIEEKLKLTQLTNVQKHTIPKILEGRDVLVQSQTGSGKTMAYAIPIVQTLQCLTPRVQRSDGPYAVVIVPTRELAVQSFETFQKLVKPFLWVVPGCIMGGEKRKAEKARLRKGINILVGTPGRLLDHIENTNSLSLGRVKWLVVDEADRLLDMGYEKDVGQIISTLDTKGAPHRQTILLSATLSQGVERLAGMTLQNPERVSISRDNEDQAASDRVGRPSSVSLKDTKSSSPTTESFAVPENLQQHFVITPCKLRLVTLAAFVMWKCKLVSKRCKMIVFFSTQDSVEFHYSLFQHVLCGKNRTTVRLSDESDSDIESQSDEDELELFRLHGDMQQTERTKVYKQYCQASSGVLFCTDVASRGLHLPHVQWIVQFTSPGAATDYIHRVGRTARAGKQGQSLLFLMPSEVEYMKLLNQHKISLSEMQMSDILKSLQLVVDHLPRFQPDQNMYKRNWNMAATYTQLCFEEYLLKNIEILNLAKKAYQSFIRAYATYPAQMKSVFHVKHLHLGHVAKSFGLREAPKTVGLGVKLTSKKTKYIDKSSRDMGIKKSSRVMSEFSSGLDTEHHLPKKKMKTKK